MNSPSIEPPATPQVPAPAGPRTPKFARDSAFASELRRRVNQYFATSGLPQRDCPAMYAKTAVLLGGLALSYWGLVFAAETLWQGLLCAALLVLAMGGVGFSVQHDANHGAYSKRAWVNQLMGLSLDLMGGSSYIWRWKHNVSHHTYPNLHGADEDIEVGVFGRLAPGQKWHWMHRYQPLYLWVAYGLLIMSWHFFYDFQRVVQGRIAQNRFPRPRGWDLVTFIAGKLGVLFFCFALPLQLHAWWVVLPFYVGCAFALSLLISMVFQLAHVVEEASFLEPDPAGRELPVGWAEHQVRSTVDFARGNPLLTWYLGGLNFQVEHHLFPKICHVHYAALSRIVQEVCAEFGVPYTAHPRLFGAVRSHWRWLRKMGQPAAAQG